MVRLPRPGSDPDKTCVAPQNGQEPHLRVSQRLRDEIMLHMVGRRSQPTFLRYSDSAIPWQASEGEMKKGVRADRRAYQGGTGHGREVPPVRPAGTGVAETHPGPTGRQERRGQPLSRLDETTSAIPAQVRVQVYLQARNASEGPLADPFACASGLFIQPSACASGL